MSKDKHKSRDRALACIAGTARKRLHRWGWCWAPVAATYAERNHRGFEAALKRGWLKVGRSPVWVVRTPWGGNHHRDRRTSTMITHKGRNALARARGERLER